MWGMDFNGTWHVVSSPDFEDDYLNMRVPAHVTLRQNGDFVMGEYEKRVQYGTSNGGVYEDFIDFDFEGNDEMEDAFGEGHAGRGTPDLRALALSRRRLDLRVRATEVEALSARALIR
jgi:hypothetical protein